MRSSEHAGNVCVDLETPELISAGDPETTNERGTIEDGSSKTCSSHSLSPSHFLSLSRPEVLNRG